MHKNAAAGLPSERLNHTALKSSLADERKQSAKGLLLEDIEKNVDAFGASRVALDNRSWGWLRGFWLEASKPKCGWKIGIVSHFRDHFIPGSPPDGGERLRGEDGWEYGQVSHFSKYSHRSRVVSPPRRAGNVEVLERAAKTDGPESPDLRVRVPNTTDAMIMP